MTCENCGAPLRLDRERGLLVCDYCAGEFVPPAGEDGVRLLGDTKFKCPACQAMLSDGQLEQHPLLYCTHCHGMLIGMDDFLPLIETLRIYSQHSAMSVPPRVADTGTLPRLCPRCSLAMDNHPYGGPGNVMIDTCEACSVNWLDKGELLKIVAAPDYACPEPVAKERD